MDDEARSAVNDDAAVGRRRDLSPAVMPARREVPPPVPDAPEINSSVPPEAKQVKLVVRVEPGAPVIATVAPMDAPGGAVAEPLPATAPGPSAPPMPPTQPSSNPTSAAVDLGEIPARMLNEFVYCPRLFYYEFVEGVFVASADTLRGDAIHHRVDSGSGALPKAKVKAADASPGKAAAAKPDPEAGSQRPDAPNAEPEIIHSRSVSLGSPRLGVVAKLDLVESKTGRDDLFAALEVCPVDYKAGAPKEGAEANELWDPDKMQLGLQALILRDNGYPCNEGVIYYRATKQRVRLPITAELETWILQTIAECRQAAAGPMPPPLVHSPKCARCSLAPVCLPDETRMLAGQPDLAPAQQPPASEPPRRLMAARDDSRALYLNTQGYRVGCKDEVLQVKERDRVVEEIRMRDLSHVALFGNIQITTQALQSLCELEVPVTYFSMGGWFYGITRGHGLKNVFLRLEQFRQARDPAACLALARQFVRGKIRNHRTLLMRNHLDPPPATLLKLKHAAEATAAAASLGELLGLEGAAANLYFQHFSGLIKVADDLPSDDAKPAASGERQLTFNFTHRNRRPPTDPVNAMLSLAYSMLAKDCTLAALTVGFDPYVGFYHQPRFGRPALALDLMEEFRPLIAESTVLSCLNNRVITEKDFVRAGQAVNLSAPGRKRFFQMYEQRMVSLLTHPLFDYKVSYRRALELQARLLAKALTGEIAEYTPLITR
jgi:CRISP-associated protein Cas1